MANSPKTGLRRSLVLLLLLPTFALVLMGLGCPPEGRPGTGHGDGPDRPHELPFERTEDRADCEQYDRLRRPFFGETHIHTALSADAALNGTENDARDAYRFAMGEEIELTSVRPGFRLKLERPLDFAAVTDHAEYLGELKLCFDPSSPHFNEAQCLSLRGNIGSGSPANFGFITLFLPSTTPGTPRFPWCGPNGGILCLDAARTVWQDIQSSAEEFYDRSSECSFTTFVAYEWSGNTTGNNLHRNVIFRNDDVPATPTSYYEAGFPEDLWDALERDCDEALERCDVLAIPHNSNISGGAMFAAVDGQGNPLTAEMAEQRVRNEPVFEINQHKADSECFPGIGNNDELCGFEKTSGTRLVPPVPGTPIPRLNFVREALKDGLALEDQLGVNPFKLGFLAATDGHMANAGQTREDDYAFAGHVGSLDIDPVRRLNLNSTFGNEASSGGLAVVWAEENSRDSLFAAIERREVYGTSGTRPVVRMFGGPELHPNMCHRGNFARRGYRSGVPMGGSLNRQEYEEPIRIAVSALQDVGTPDAPGTPLQRIQIIKGWVDADGQTQEETYDVAGDPDNGASVDLATCEPQGEGYSSLCTVWEDPAFDPSQRAFYYARVVENPSCRWTGFLCQDAAVDCSDPAGIPAGYERCCDGSVPLTLQERAWTSPIWYDPAEETEGEEDPEEEDSDEEEGSEEPQTEEG